MSISLKRGQSSIFFVIKTVGEKKEKVSEGQQAFVPHFVKMNVAHHGNDNHKKCSIVNKVQYERFKKYGLKIWFGVKMTQLFSVYQVILEVDGPSV